MAGYRIDFRNRFDALRLAPYEDFSYDNFIAFVEDILGPYLQMPFINENYYRRVWDNTWSGRYTLTMLPRGHSKSEFLGVWLTIYLAIYQHKNFFSKENKRIEQQLIVSSDSTTSVELFDRIKKLLESSPLLRQYLPARNISGRYNNEKIVLKNGSILYCRSIKLKRGLHVDRIICDDLTTESSTLTDKETWDFFTGALLPMINAKMGIIQACGTPIRFTDINMRIKGGDAGDHWNVCIIPAITDWEKKEIISPKRFTWDLLMETRKTIGSVKFESEYMLNPLDSETTLIKREWIEGCFSTTEDIYTHRAHFEEVYLGVDFAFSDRESADWSVFCIVGYNRGQYQLIDYHRRRGMSASEQLRFIQELHAVFRFDLIGLEENSIQSVIKDWRSLGLPLKLYHTGSVDERQKKQPDNNGVISVKKENLVIRLGTTFENHGIILPYKSDKAKEKMNLLLNECISWQLQEGKLVEVGVHPDIPIALGYALEVATKASFSFVFA